MKYKILKATHGDKVEIEHLIANSVRVLGLDFYTPEQIEGALLAAWGLDSQLISDLTYFIIKDGSTLIACGGWSYRETLFGNDTEESRSDNIINLETGAAKIRAFFVNPDYARQGIGSLLMRECEKEARQMGYKRLELMATLPGKKLYEKHGFLPGKPTNYSLHNNLTIEFVPMRKDLLGESRGHYT